MKCKLSKCRAHSMKESEFCFSHNPDSKGRHLQAASKGGSNSVSIGEKKLDHLSLNTPESIVVLLEDTINRIRITREDGTMDLRTAKAIGYLSSQIIKAIEVSDVNERLELVERIIFERKKYS